MSARSVENDRKHSDGTLTKGRYAPLGVDAQDGLGYAAGAERI
jgi:hypothetical protein